MEAQVFLALLVLPQAVSGSFTVSPQVNCLIELTAKVFLGANGTTSVRHRFEQQNKPGEVINAAPPRECLNQRPTKKGVIKVGTFHFPPFTIKRINKDTGQATYSGIEVTIVQELAQSLGYQVEFTQPSDGKLWGDIYWNGTTTGLLADIVTGKVDVGMAEYFLWAARSFFGDASQFYTYDGFCPVAAKPNPEARWKQWARPFSIRIWIGLLTCWFAGTFVMVVGKSFFPDEGNYAALLHLAFYVNQSVRIRQSWKAIKTYIGIVTICGGLLSIAYSSVLISFLAITTYPPLMEKLTDLAKFHGAIAADGQSFRNRFAEHEDPLIHGLADRYVPILSWQDAMRETAAGNYAYFASKIFAEYVTSIHYTDEYGFSLLYVLKECWNSNQIVFYYPKNSPLRQRFDVKLWQLRESGIINKWIDDEIHHVGQQGTDKKAKASTLKKLSLEDYRGILTIQGICLACCCLAFAGEEVASIFHQKIRKIFCKMTQ